MKIGLLWYSFSFLFVAAEQTGESSLQCQRRILSLLNADTDG